jgi:addiction module HigA family antidote
MRQEHYPGEIMVLRQNAASMAPPHPGWILRDRVLPGLGLSVSQAARELRIARQTLHRVLAGTASITPEMAARLARLSGTAPQFWLNLQQQHDLWHAEQALSGVLSLIPTHTLPATIQTEIGHSHDR